FDQYGSSMGDVTPATTFSLSPDGSCTAATCTATVADSGTSHHTVTAHSSGKTATAALTINAGPASRLAFSTQPAASQSITAGGAVPLGVSVEDASGNVVTSDNSTTVGVATGNNPGASMLSCTNPGATGPVTVVNGVAGLSCSLNKVGSGYTLTATSNPAHGT